MSKQKSISPKRIDYTERLELTGGQCSTKTRTIFFDRKNHPVLSSFRLVFTKYTREGSTSLERSHKRCF